MRIGVQIYDSYFANTLILAPQCNAYISKYIPLSIYFLKGQVFFFFTSGIVHYFRKGKHEVNGYFCVYLLIQKGIRTGQNQHSYEKKLINEKENRKLLDFC